jgi:Holliday junction DNA helicase RuvA
MIVGAEGEIILKEPTFLHLKVGGFIYEINISLNTSNAINSSTINLLITQIIREDSNNLYGFLDLLEKSIFDRLIKINGVGAKVALAVCSTFTPAEFAQIIKTKDSNMLKKVAGIGPKSASRILVELEDFELEIKDSTTKAKNEAIMALESLGFKRSLIIKALADETGEDSATLVKIGLKKLSKV